MYMFMYSSRCLTDSHCYFLGRSANLFLKRETYAVPRNSRFGRNGKKSTSRSMAKAKGKGEKGKKGKKEKVKEPDPGADPVCLHQQYLKQCEFVGIEVQNDDPVSKALLREENPSRGCQILIGRDGDEDGNGSSSISPGCCRALVAAILGQCHGGDNIPFTALKEIRIWRSSIGNIGAAAIAQILRTNDPNLQLRYLELPDNDISTQGGLILGRSLCGGMNKNLLTLNLDHNPGIGSVGISALTRGLKTNSTLKTLSARYCNIDQNGGFHVNEILSFPESAIETLDLTGNSLGGSGLKAFCPGIEISNSLKRIRIADNNISSSETDVSTLNKFAKVLCNHPSIIEVDLLYNSIGDPGGIALLDGIGSNKKITILKVDMNLSPELYCALSRKKSDTKKNKKGKKKKKK